MCRAVENAPLTRDHRTDQTNMIMDQLREKYADLVPQQQFSQLEGLSPRSAVGALVAEALVSEGTEDKEEAAKVIGAQVEDIGESDSDSCLIQLVERLLQPLELSDSVCNVSDGRWLALALEVAEQDTSTRNWLLLLLGRLADASIQNVKSLSCVQLVNVLVSLTERFVLDEDMLERLDVLLRLELRPIHLLRLLQLTMSLRSQDNNPYIRRIMELLHSEQDTHFRMDHASLTLNFDAGNFINGSYTAQLWFKTNTMDDGELISMNGKTKLVLESSQISVYHKDSFINKFDKYDFHDNQYYQVVITHELSATGDRSRAKLSLYVNGSYVQRLRSPYPFSTGSSPMETRSHMAHVTLGSMHADYSFTALGLFKGSLPHEWIALSYHLGRNYNGLFQDEDMLQFLNYRDRTEFNLKLLDASTNEDAEFDLNKLQLCVLKDQVLVSFNAHSVISSDFDLDKSDLTSEKHTIFGRIQFHESQDISELFYSVSALQFVFTLIETSSTPQALYDFVELLLDLVGSNWKIIREMEMINGYSILSILLKLKKNEFKQSFRIDLFALILKSVGFDFESPFNSVIINHLAYDHIILDLQLWKPVANEETEEDLEVIRFLTFQVTAFARECRYNSFNIMKLKKLKIVRRFLNYLNQGFFPEKVWDSLQDALSVLVRTNLSVDSIKSISSFVIYSLNEGNYNNGLLALKILADIYLDPLLVNGSQWKKLFGAISMKYIFLLFQLGKKDKLIIDYSLTLLIRLFTMSNKSYEVFLKNNGPFIVLASMRDIKLDHVEFNLLVNGSVGRLQVDLSFDKLKGRPSISPVDKVVIPELHHLVFDLFEWMVLNDIFQTDGHNTIIVLINDYIDFLSDVFEQNSSFVETFQYDKAFFRRLCNLVLLLNKPRNTSIYFDSSEKVVELLAARVLAKLFNSDLATIESYISDLISSGNEGSNAIIPTVYLALVFPKVLVHLVGFSSEFGTLLQTDSLKFPNVAIFLNLMYGELLSFEWASRDYFNYVSVVLSLAEAYRKSGKSLRATQYMQLQKNITPILNSLLFVLKDSGSVEQRLNFLKILMFHQENLFSTGSVTGDCAANIICLLLQIATIDQREVSSLALNCLRIILMHFQGELSSICSSITFISHASVLKFLQSATTVSDEELILQFTENRRIVSLFGNHLEAIDGKVQRKFTKRPFITAEEQLQELYARHDRNVKEKHETIDKLLNLLQNDNEILRQKIVHTETTILVRFLKDQYDVLQFRIAAYNKLKLETKKRLALQFDESFEVKMWILDSMEGIDRIRKRLLPYDDLEKDQQLKSTIDVPTKKLSNGNKIDEPPRIESLSLHSFDMVEADAIEDSLNNYSDRNRTVLKSLFAGDRIVDIWNVGQVVGLEITEGILILGLHHIYLIQGYFHKAETDEIVDISDVPESERDPNVKLISGQPGSPTTSSGQGDSHSVSHWDLYKLTSVTKRQFLLRDVALELFFSNGASFLVTAVKTRQRDAIFAKLSSVATNSNIDNDLSAIFKETNTNNPAFTGSSRRFGSKLSDVFHLGYENVLDATKKWQSGEMSNFYYLVIINTLAGRTFNDLTQYPVFPWVISDYTSEELDLNDSSSFRDLSKPMGAQNPQRANLFKERYEALESLQDELSIPFHYGTHYSSAMIVASFLIRLEPFVQSFLLLQGGKFDHADRLFYSIEKAWKSSSSENTTDVRELIPEFFFLPEFLTNLNRYDFGKLQDGSAVNDVELPKWAKGDPKIFIAKNREALESPYVSAHLHEWIDLIFGFKQLGPKAVEAINVFNHLSYQGAIDLDRIDNEQERRSVIGIIHNFGQTPAQIFPKPHPSREYSLKLSINLDIINWAPLLLYQTKFKDSIQYLQFKTHSGDFTDAFWRGYPKLFLSGQIEVREADHDGSLLINRRTFEKLHDENITALARVDDELFLTGSESGVIHVWRYVILIRGFKEKLHFETKLTLHADSIIEFKISPEFAVLVSLDSGGMCYMWDLVSYKFIRRIAIGVEHVAIAYDTGMVAVSAGTTVRLYTINGELICEKTFDRTSRISALNFANSRTVSTIKINNVENHEYWHHEAILTTGWSNGEICLSELRIGAKGWSLEAMKVLKFADAKEAGFKTAPVTIVESYLKSYVDYEGIRGGKVEVVAGDEGGRVAVWRT